MYINATNKGYFKRTLIFTYSLSYMIRTYHKLCFNVDINKKKCGFEISTTAISFATWNSIRFEYVLAFEMVLQLIL